MIPSPCCTNEQWFATLAVVTNGAVYVYSGATGALLMTMAGTPVYSFLGGSVALAGDVNGDGVEDIVAGGAGNGSVNIPGFVRVYSGAGGFALHTAIGPSVRVAATTTGKASSSK